MIKKLETYDYAVIQKIKDIAKEIFPGCQIYDEPIDSKSHDIYIYLPNITIDFIVFPNRIHYCITDKRTNKIVSVNYYSNPESTKQVFLKIKRKIENIQ